MSISGIHGQLLEVTVVGCTKLKDTEWISRQDPYVCLEYASTKVRTPTCTDGGKNPTFQQKFVFNLIEGLREINVSVWNSNTITTDDFIGSGKIQLLKVLSQGFDDSSWSLQTKTGRHAGEVRVIMHYANSNKPATSYAPSAPPYGSPAASLYSTPPMATGSYPPPPAVSYTPPAAYPAPHSYSSYPPNPTAYPPPPMYHSQPPPAYPGPHGAPSPYPPSPYPPSPYDPSHYHTGAYPGAYPPPPY
ncbi:OLC1v1003323C1 [Oldenlandia corymbosa var. corymbosa]|uniref:OLC1v1003323C1 n=1 Tax=Oldenlandia corymbosa var. corymbosa TaxID=529605 RepID=A0AAV1DBN7_OLDCO|nr:OLC1v1003323C1 [Oldenlandia corymbosa var. corymbosa]